MAFRIRTEKWIYKVYEKTAKSGASCVWCGAAVKPGHSVRYTNFEEADECCGLSCLLCMHEAIAGTANIFAEEEIEKSTRRTSRIAMEAAAN